MGGNPWRQGPLQEKSNSRPGEKFLFIREAHMGRAIQAEDPVTDLRTKSRTQAPQPEERKAGPHPQKGDVTNKEWCQSMGHIGRQGGAITQGRGSVMEKRGKNLVPELRPVFPCHVYR